MHYQLIQIQKALLHKPSQVITQLPCLSANMHTKMQEIRCGCYKYYISYRDGHQFVRMLVFSLLAKLYQELTSFNKKSMAVFKKMIYSSSLTELLSLYNMPLEQLFMLLALKISQIPISRDSDENVCKFMNCEPIVEEILLAAIEEVISVDQASLAQKQSIQTSKHSALIQWLDKLGFTVKITNQPVLEQKENEIFLTIIGQRIARQAYKQQIEQQSISSSSLRIDSELQAAVNRTPMLESIIFNDRSFYQGTIQKQKEDIAENNKQNKMISSQWKNCGVNRRKKQNKSFFDVFFCCSSD